MFPPVKYILANRGVLLSALPTMTALMLILSVSLTTSCSRSRLLGSVSQTPNVASSGLFQEIASAERKELRVSSQSGPKPGLPDVSQGSDTAAMHLQGMSFLPLVCFPEEFPHQHLLVKHTLFQTLGARVDFYVPNPWSKN